MRVLGILAAWPVIQIGDTTYMQGFWVTYMRHVAKLYDKVYIIAPTKYKMDEEERLNRWTPLEIDSIEIVPLPYLPPVGTYIAALPHFYSYLKAVRSVQSKVTDFYVRTPDPFCWLPQFVGCPRVTMHYVGSSLGTTWHSNRSFFQKLLRIIPYLPEYTLTLIASKMARVMVNGEPIARGLRRFGISCTTVISSTLSEDDFFTHDILSNSHDEVRLLYVGFLRTSKGIEKVIDAAFELQNRKIKFHLDIVGGGESEVEFRKHAESLVASNLISFHGHVDAREKLWEFYRRADLFLFMSVSEGSPRVVLEAMSATMLVISTPVGSLPDAFKHQQEILFVDHSVKELADTICKAIKTPEASNKIAHAAQQAVHKNHMQEGFIKQVFIQKN